MLIKLQTTSLTIFCVYYIGDEENSENAEFILCHVLATEFANGNFYQFLSPHSCFARAQFSYTMDATLPSFPAFDPSPEAGDVALRWRKWVSRFRILLAAINVTNDTRQKALLLHYAGERVSDIFDTLTIPDPTGDESSTELAINALTLFFAPYANVEFAVFQFRQAKQEQTEDIASYLTPLRQLALNCDFSDVSRELKSQIIQGCRSTRLRRKALTDPTITLDNLVNLARAAEAADAHTSAMTSDTIPELVSRLKTHPSSSTTPHSRSTGKNQSTCRNCGKLWPHAGGREDCPAFDKTCRGCSKRGNFFSVCRSSNTAGNSRTSPAPRPLRVNHLEKRDTDSESDVEYLYAVRAHPMAAKPPMFNILLDGIPILVMAESGASVNSLDDRDFNKLSPRRKLIHTTTRIFPYQGSTPLPVLGKLTLTVTHKSYRQRADFYVVTGTCGSILSWETSNQLHLINVVNRVTISSPKLLDEFQDIFTGLGKLKNFQVKLHINNTVAPTAQPHRRIPFLLRKQVEAQLEADLQLGVIEKVEGATPWVSPIVVVPKPKCPGAVRICIDMRRANTAIRRERHLTPTISDIIHDLNGAKVFSKLDLNQGYNQSSLNPALDTSPPFLLTLGCGDTKDLTLEFLMRQKYSKMLFENHLMDCVESPISAMTFWYLDQIKPNMISTSVLACSAYVTTV